MPWFGIGCRAVKLVLDLIVVRRQTADKDLEILLLRQQMRVLEAFQEWQDETFLDDSGQNASPGLAQIVSLRDNDPGFRQYNPNWPTNDGRYLGIFPGIPPTGFAGEAIQIGVHERKHRKGITEARYVQRLVRDHINQLWERCHLA